MSCLLLVLICLCFRVYRCMLFEGKMIYWSSRYHNAMFPALWVPNYHLLVDDLLVCKLSGNRPYIPKVFNSICMPDIWADDDDFRTRYENHYLKKTTTAKIQIYHMVAPKVRHYFCRFCVILYFSLPEIIIIVLAHWKIFLNI